MKSRRGVPPHTSPSQTEANPATAPKPHAWRLKWLGLVGLLMVVVACLWWWADSEQPGLENTWQDIRFNSGLPSTPALSWRLDLDLPTEGSQVPNTSDPEQFVRQIYAQLGEGERAQALATASVLVARFPNFQLGQLLYADLLNISSSQPVAWSDSEELNAPSLRKRLDELILESKRRLQRDSAQSLQGKIPSALTFLSPQQTYVAAVDASKSRLYWFENRSGPDGRLQLHLVKETYISVGINGVGKDKEGDGKTPLGVYFILRNLPGEGLPDLFGVGALTLNYPNAVDLMRKKTGSGIWLHGTPSAQYARAPESTDGCVVLSNPEMQRLLQMPELRMTPVVIAEQLEWVNADQAKQSWDAFKPALDKWLKARNGRDPQALKTHYSPRYEQDGQSLDQVWPRLVQTTLGHGQSQPLELVSVLNWKDQELNMVVTMKDPNQTHPQGASYLRMYWQKENGQWRLVFQGPT
ncbi:L,D-transpeptidase family protein [Limnohabitans sp. Rim8]|uniref:L,D-transpeptidase family protein n=1 Tax=Limnohabitans sp. Rim8 TaxID=1100718 RepID=UPI0025E18E33|nr:L,D-transpeptidase family protein [Limnohabitans sp. Rim8]